VTSITKTSPGHVVKIADFGTIRCIGPGTFLGDPDFIAPELAHQPVMADHRADLYSLGAVLYFLLAGRPPFPGGTAEEKVRHHTWTEPVRIDHLRPEVHPAVAGLVHQLLAKQPQARPASADEVADRLAGGYSAAATGVSFELPPPNVGPYSFCGQLSGNHAVPMATVVADPSGGCVHPTSGAFAIAEPAAETSPWEQITEEYPACTTPLMLPAQGYCRRRPPGLGLGSLVVGMFMATLVGIGLLVKVLAR
jgi:serine/threonine protein kinase